MPKDDWAKYARRDRGRKAARGSHFRKGAVAETFDDLLKARDKGYKKRKKKLRTSSIKSLKARKAQVNTHAAPKEDRTPANCVRVRYDGYVVVYHGPPETAILREIVFWDWSKPWPAWPGFTPRTQEASRSHFAGSIPHHDPKT